MSIIDGDNRLFKIIKIIEQSNSLILQSIADKLGLSTKTVKNEIKEINKVLEGCAFIDIKNNKCAIYIFNEENYEKVKLKLCKQDSLFNSQQGRMSYIFYKLINSNEGYLTDDLAEEMNIGRTTFIGDLKKLREKIIKYNIEIIGKTNKGLFLKGNELDIRMYIINEMYFSIYNKFELDNKILDLVHNENLLGTEITNHFIKFLTVAVDRILKGYKIDDLNSNYTNLKNNNAYMIVNKILIEVGKILNIDISDNEKVFMTLPLVSMRTPINIKESDNIDIPKETIELVNEIIDFINKELNINIKPGDCLDEFLCHIYFMINRVKFGIKIDNPIVEDIKEKYSLAYKMAELSSNLIESKLGKKISKDEIGYMAMYFEVFISENLYISETLYRVAVVCRTGVLTARIISSQLKKILSKDTIIDIYSGNEINETALNEYDLIFSTFKLKFNLDTPIIYIKEIFDEYEFRKKIEQVKFTERLDIPLIQGIDSIMLSILDKDNFFVLDSRKSYEENIDIMLNSLYENGYTDGGFKERLKQREESSTMVFDNNIALPHVINYESDKIVFALGVSDSSLRGKDVNIVFLLGVPKDIGYNEELLIKIYNEIISIAKNKVKVNQLSNIKKYSELVQYMIRENKFV